MKKLFCILAGAALLGACEQKTETVAPAPADKNTTIVNPATGTEKTKETNTNTTNTINTSSPSSETKSTTTTTTSPNP